MMSLVTPGIALQTFDMQESRFFTSGRHDYMFTELLEVQDFFGNISSKLSPADCLICSLIMGYFD